MVGVVAARERVSTRRHIMALALFESRGSVGEQIHGTREAARTRGVAVEGRATALVVGGQVVAHVGGVFGEGMWGRDVGRANLGARGTARDWLCGRRRHHVGEARGRGGVHEALLDGLDSGLVSSGMLLALASP